ncbi:hypothetical protein [Devriesea agamarum]|uniref:hypothetical protein n=1 Tax=Devriesea agamarum TaxID=472569 RepID=UPI00071CE0A0|nr:hypothetical protein [Devriesea agamarum]
MDKDTIDRLVVDAVQDQRPLVLSVLKHAGMLDLYDDAMNTIACDLIAHLDLWVTRDDASSIRRWACGRAYFEIKKFVRSQRVSDGLGVLTRVEWEDEVIEALPAVEQTPDRPHQYLGVMHRVRALIIAQPGGVARWEEIRSLAEQPVRGRELREELRTLMSEVSGLPRECFSAEHEEARRSR